MIWKDVLGYEGFYKVSDCGLVKSIGYAKKIILKHNTNRGGYSYVILCKDNLKSNKTIHRLVWEAFNGSIETYEQIDHINGIKSDNNISNLQLLSGRENTSKHRLSLKKSSKYVGVCWNKKSNKWQSYILINGKIKYLGLFLQELEAANAYQQELLKLNQTK